MKNTGIGIHALRSIDHLQELDEAYPDVDLLHVNFVDLRNWIMALAGFNDDPEHCGERILEAVQMVWVEERED